MTLARKVKRQIRAVLPACLFMVLTGYFFWNSTRGELGLHAYKRRVADLATAQALLASASMERDEWQRRVYSMGNAHLDADLLDERSRAGMNQLAPGDIVVTTPN